MALAGKGSHARNILSAEHVSSDNPKKLCSFHRHDSTDFPCKYMFRPVLNKLYEECKACFYSQCCRELRKTTRFTNHPPKTLQLCSLLASRGPLSAVLSYSSSKGDNLGVTVFKRHEKSENVVFKKRDLILSYAAEEGQCRTSVP